MKSVLKTTCFCPWHGGEDTTLTEIDIGYDDDGDVVGIGELSIERNPDTGFVASTALGAKELSFIISSSIREAIDRIVK